MITLKWSKYPEVDVVKYKVYKSIIGFKAIKAPPVSLVGLTLSLSINGGPIQNILFQGTASVIDQLNAVLVNARAYQSSAEPGYFYVRDNLRNAPGSVEILSCTALSALGLTPKIITAKSETFLIGEIVANQTPGSVEEFDDVDGSLYDYYAISSINSVDDESLKTPLKQPVDTSGLLCVIEGYVCDLQGSRIPDAVVTVTLQQAPKNINDALLTKEPISVLSGPDGKFSVPIVRGALVKIDINKVSFSRNVTIPNQSFVLLKDLLVDGTYQYAEDI
jgi:hypothetical protein